MTAKSSVRPLRFAPAWWVLVVLGTGLSPVVLPDRPLAEDAIRLVVVALALGHGFGQWRWPPGEISPAGLRWRRGLHRIVLTPADVTGWTERGGRIRVHLSGRGRLSLGPRRAFARASWRDLRAGLEALSREGQALQRSRNAPGETTRAP